MKDFDFGIGAESAATPDAAILRFLGRYLAEPTDIRTCKGKLDADPIHRTQTIMHTRVLRDRCIVVSSELVEAVLEGFVEKKTATA